MVKKTNTKYAVTAVFVPANCSLGHILIHKLHQLEKMLA